MARSGTYGTKQNKVEDCRQWPLHHQGVTGRKQVSNMYIVLCVLLDLYISLSVL